jgi:hypothetical protein
MNVKTEVVMSLSVQSLKVKFLRETNKYLAKPSSQYVSTWFRDDSLKNLEMILSPAFPEIFRDVPKEDFTLQEYTCGGNDEPVC